ncbi:hypothetical protein PsYK624_077820 [Phanerochaete sordida]|uniref:Uncharacterized protein n=1 Tax=Phanerochaete sordida TaxID=48140 RepID=A0A9P3LF36_9APHY|nr:hypothetical protein PsYK624_077820 [Phanerochaete sordida]
MSPTPRRKTSWSAYRTHAAICIGLHGILILLHIILLALCVRRAEHSVTFALTPFSVEWYPLAVTTAMQVFGTLILAALVASTQSLAFRSDLYVRQTLTALHDKSSAWLGLGAACSSLWEQFKMRAAMLGVAYITAYLVGMWLLHVTIPTVLSVVPYNDTVPMLNRTILANTTTSHSNYASAYDILLFSDQVPTLGLQENMIYDIIPTIPSAYGSTAVNASVYDVDCTALPTVGPPDAFGSGGGGGLPLTEMMLFYVDSPGNKSNLFSASLPYSASAVYTGQPLVIEHRCSASDPSTGYHPGTCWTPIFLLSTVAIVDADGKEPPVPGGAWVSIDPLVSVVSYPYADPAVLITGLQILACSVQITNIKIDVSVDTRTPLAPPPPPKADVHWRDWTWPDDPALTDQLRAAQNTPYFSPLSGHSSSLTVSAGLANLTDGAPPQLLPGFNYTAFQVDPPQRNVVINTFLRESDSYPVAPSAFDVFLSEDLRLASGNRTNVSVAEINHSMAKALAAVAWYSNNMDSSSPHAIDKLTQLQSTFVSPLATEFNLTLVGTDDALSHYGEATINVVVQRLRLNLSILPILVGLVTSVVLLVVAILVIRVPASARAAFDPDVSIDSGGLLQYTWLLGNEPHLAEVEHPELENLRAAGMFDVHVGDRLKRRLDDRLPSVDDDSM